MNSPEKRGRPRKAKAVPKLPNESTQGCSSAAASASAKPAVSLSSLPIKKAGRGRPKGQKQPPKPKSGGGRGRPPITGGHGAAKEAANNGTGMRGRPKKKVSNVEPVAALNAPELNGPVKNNEANAQPAAASNERHQLDVSVRKKKAEFFERPMPKCARPKCTPLIPMAKNFGNASGSTAFAAITGPSTSSTTSSASYTPVTTNSGQVIMLKSCLKKRPGS